MSYLFTSESVSAGHPDKVADQISDAILDALLAQDPFSRVGCEVLVTSKMVVIAGEITTTACVDYEEVTRKTLHRLGYTNDTWGLDGSNCSVLCLINKQSTDIADSINQTKAQGYRAGDQGIVFGYAIKEASEYMPLPIILAHELVKKLDQRRKDNTFSFLGPDAKSQVTVAYSKEGAPQRIHTIVLSAQHHPDISLEKLNETLIDLCHEVLPDHLLDSNTRFFINPSGRFVQGGPAADCGLTGRKIMVDTYGGMSKHGGGAFSGKDPSKMDRSAAYMARYIAKNVVAARLATRCEVSLSYAIGVEKPIAVYCKTFDTGALPEELLWSLLKHEFDCTPKGIITHLSLERPIYESSAAYGHFGRSHFPWEQTNIASELEQQAFAFV